VRQKNGKDALVYALPILIIAAAAVCARATYLYAEDPWRPYALWCIALATLLYVIFEALNLTRFIRGRSKTGDSSQRQSATTLVLLSEDGTDVRFWDLRDRIGLVIGRSADGADADIDLSDTEYFSLISSQHAVLNYTNRGWYLADAGSKNGTALSRGASGQKLLLAPGEPVPISPGDTIYLAEATMLAVR
jgi:hypothetical protein